MYDPDLILALASIALLAIALLSFTGLKAWNNWLELKRAELATGGWQPNPGLDSSAIELADLKARVRKLEAIASGINL